MHPLPIRSVKPSHWCVQMSIPWAGIVSRAQGLASISSSSRCWKVVRTGQGKRPVAARLRRCFLTGQRVLICCHPSRTRKGICAEFGIIILHLVRGGINPRRRFQCAPLGDHRSVVYKLRPQLHPPRGSFRGAAHDFAGVQNQSAAKGIPSVVVLYFLLPDADSHGPAG